MFTLCKSLEESPAKDHSTNNNNTFLKGTFQDTHGDLTNQYYKHTHSQMINDREGDDLRAIGLRLLMGFKRVDLIDNYRI